MVVAKKIDTIECVGKAYWAFFTNFYSFAFVVIGWTALAVAVLSATLLAFSEARNLFPEFTEVIFTWPEPPQNLLILSPVLLIVVLGSASLIVAWHRLVILGRRPASPFPTGLGTTFFYLAWLLIVFAIPMVPLSMAAFYYFRLVLFASWSAGDDPLAKGLLVVAGVIAVMLVVGRLSLVLPGLAVGDRSMTLTQSWRVTEGNSWRLFWGAFLAVLPFSIVSNLSEKITESVPQMEGTISGIVVLMVGAVADIMSYVVAAGFFSAAYMHFTSTGTGVADQRQSWGAALSFFAALDFYRALRQSVLEQRATQSTLRPRWSGSPAPCRLHRPATGRGR